MPDEQPSVYRPEVFTAVDQGAARRIILTPGAETTVDARCEAETPVFAEAIAEMTGLQAGQLLLDFGFGIGRMSKALIDRTGCTALGVDISASMILHGWQYVGDPRLVTTTPMGLDGLSRAGVKADVAIAILVLQHTLNPAEELDRILAGLKPGGLFFLANATYRCVPTNHGWTNDGQDVWELAEALFDFLAEASPAVIQSLPAENHGDHRAAVFRKPA